MEKFWGVPKAEEVCGYFKEKINAPYVGCSISKLGGDERASILLHLSLDPKESWNNGIYHNSRFMIFSFERDGGLESIAQGFRPHFRKARSKSIEEALSKINGFIKKVNQ